jgi:hypothetical protein
MSNARMPESGRREIRIVVQHIYRPSQSTYRLIAYGDDRRYHPVEFESLESLVGKLKAVLPDFDEQSLAPASGASTHIVFSSLMALTDTEMSRLGLTAL